jgi:hypothetical protein
MIWRIIRILFNFYFGSKKFISLRVLQLQVSPFSFPGLIYIYILPKPFLATMIILFRLPSKFFFENFILGSIFGALLYVIDDFPGKPQYFSLVSYQLIS